MFLVAAIVSTLASTGSPALCAGCTLDAPVTGEAMPLLVVLRDDRAGRAWRAPALAGGFAILTLAGWQRDEPRWIEDQVFAAARQRSIDLARVYLVGDGDGAVYVARHVDALSETFAAVVITGGGEAPTVTGCPTEVLPAYFALGGGLGSGDASDPGTAALRGYFERCRQPVTTSRQPAPAVLDWLRRHVRVTTVS